ncbi:hypothetical protein HNQ46_002035 [Oribacterium sinus]|uniref:SpaA-like prealbumin fold domain-containing protein n=1 Tax=Oribacterium sinus TaxID=237576 RepID=A0A7W9SIH1_9FIRM|nr:SpaA isopeptide-forming pilin-related protein [Oribacterium sinus]MBB6042040.1 hypothetical protein [Oribacterium sinus]
MKRFLALFLAVSIGLQSFTAVGESSSLVGDSAVLNEQAGEKGISSGEATALTRESGEDNGEESKAEESQEASSETEASAPGETGESQETLEAQSREVKEQEGLSVKESVKEAEGEETEVEALPTLSYSTIERNEKKHFQYKDEEITVNAELEYPESLPKGVVFLVRPILEEERKEQYQAYKAALLEAKNEEKKDIENMESTGEESYVLHDLRLYDVGFFLKEEKTGDWEEVQPEKGRVKIDFTLKNSLEGEGKLQVTHLPIKQEKKQEGINSLEIPNLQKEDILVEDLEIKENKAFFSKKERIQFSLDSFSTIGIYKGEVNATEHILNDVKFTLNNINVQLKNKGGQKDFQQVAKEGNTVSWKLNENYSPYEVENLHMDIRFVRSGDSFTVKNGEKIRFSFPSILRAKGAGTYYNTGYPAKKFYKFTIRENPASKNWELEVEFLEDFELSAYGEIRGIITLDFGLDSSKLTETKDNPVEISLPEQNYKIILPPLPSVISGVKKVADAQPAKGQVAWNITLGENSPGVALNGLTVTDSFQNNHQVFLSATWLGKKDPLTGQDMTLHMTEAAGGGNGMNTYSYTFPEGGEVIRAPQTIRIVTGIRREVYKDKNATTLRNNVSLSHKNEARLPKDTNKRSTSALTTIPKISLVKSGTQVSGNRVRWKIDFNNDRAAAVQARVLDNLKKGLTLDESKGITIRYGGREATVLKPNNNHVNLAGRGFGDVNDVSYTYNKGTGPNGGDTLTLAFGTRFKEPYSIEFDTLVAEDFPLQGSGTDTTIGNQAQVIATYPTGDVAGGISDELSNQTPIVSAAFKSIFLEIKGTGTDSRKALLNWRVKATTKENYEKLKLVINNGQYHEFNSLNLRYGEGASASNLFVDKASRDKLVNQTQTETIMASDGVTPIATLNLTYIPSAGAPAGGNVELTVIRNNGVPAEERFDIGLLSWNHNSKALYYMTRKDGNHYFGSNATLSLYTHKEDTNPLKMVRSVADPQMMSQDMLRKTVQSFYDDEQKRAYFRFQITANASRMEDLKNFVLQDDLQNIFQYRKPNGQTQPLDSKYFTITTAADSKYPTLARIGSGTAEQIVSGSELTVDNVAKRVELNLQNPLSDTLYMDIYVYLNQEGQDVLFENTNAAGLNLQEAIISANNRATISSTSFPTYLNGGNPIVHEATASGTGKTQVIPNKILVKEGDQGKAGSRYQGVINWKVLINPLGGNITGGTVLMDKIPKGLFLDMKSIKLYRVKHQEHSIEINGDVNDPNNATLVPDTEWEAKRLRHFDDQHDLVTELEVILKNSTTDTYVLAYSTDITADIENTTPPFENVVYVKKASGEPDSIAKKSVKAQSFDYSTGSKKVRYVINKKDSLADNKVSLPLAGAEFGLFEEKYLPFLKTASKDALLGMAHDYGVTDAKGQVRFSGEAYDNTQPTENIYYVMEMEAPTGYKKDRRVFGPYKEDAGRREIKPIYGGKEISDAFYNFREREEYKTGSAEIKKIYEEENPRLPKVSYVAKGKGDKTGYKTKFKFYINPDPEMKGDYFKEFPMVKVDGEAGVYEYPAGIGFGESAEVETAPAVAVPDGQGGFTYEGSLQLNGLPWGQYALEEIDTETGYLLSDRIVFNVEREKTPNGTPVSSSTLNYQGEKDGERVVLRNYPTVFSFEKRDGEGNVLTGDALKGAKFRITGKTEDFLQSRDASSRYTLHSAGNESYILLTEEEMKKDGGLLGVLKTGVEYRFSEEVPPRGYEKGPAIPFTINANSGNLELKQPANASSEAGFYSSDGAKLILKDNPTRILISEEDQNFFPVAYSSYKLYLANRDGSKKEESPAFSWDNGENTEKILEKPVAGEYYRLERTAQSILYQKNATTDYALFSLSKDGKSIDAVESHGITLEKRADRSLMVKAKRILAEGSLTKIDRIDEKALEKATFALYQVKDSGKADKAEALEQGGKIAVLYSDLVLRKPENDLYLGDFTTDESGKLSTKDGGNKPNLSYENKPLSQGLPIGLYYFVETKAPTGYSIETEQSGQEKKKYFFAVRPKEDGKAVLARSLESVLETEAGLPETADREKPGFAKNTRIPGTLNLVKEAEHTGEKLSGAQYGLYLDAKGESPAKDSSGKPLVKESNEEGRLSFSNLEWYQDYYVKEVREPRGYRLDQKVYGPFRFSAKELEKETTQVDRVTGVRFNHYGIDPLLSYQEKDKKRELWENEEKLKGLRVKIKGLFKGETAVTEKTYTTDENGGFTVAGDLVAGEDYSILPAENLPASLHPMKDMHFQIDNQDNFVVKKGEDSQIFFVKDNVLELPRERTVFQLSTRVQHEEAGRSENAVLPGVEFMLYKDAAGTEAFSGKLVVNGKEEEITDGIVKTLLGKPENLDSSKKGYLMQKNRLYQEGTLRLHGLPKGEYYLKAVSLGERLPKEENVDFEEEKTAFYKLSLTDTESRLEVVSSSDIEKATKAEDGYHLQFGLKKADFSFHTTDFKTRKEDITKQTYALYVEKDWAMEKLVKGEFSEEDSIISRDSFKDREAKPEITIEGRKYVLLSIQENDESGNLSFKNLTRAKRYALLNVTKEENYQDPTEALVFQPSDEGAVIISYGRNHRIPTRPKFAGLYSIGEALYLKDRQGLYHNLGKDGILGEGIPLMEKLTFQWLLYEKEMNHGGIGGAGGGKHSFKPAVHPGDTIINDTRNPYNQNPNKPIPGNPGKRLLFVGLDANGNPIYVPVDILPGEVRRYIEKYGIPIPSGGNSQVLKNRIVRLNPKKKKKGEIGSGYSRDDLAQRLGAVLGQNRDLSQEDLEELQIIGEYLAAIRKGRVDKYGRAIATGDMSTMVLNFGLFGSSLLLLCAYSLWERKKMERKRRRVRA